MNKKVMIIVACLIFFGIIIYILNVDNKSIPKYDADIICHKTYLEVLDEEEVESTSNVYIYETNGYIDKIINQAITNDMSSESFLSELTDLYNQVEGIRAKVDIINNELVMEINYDYHSLDLVNFRNKVGNLLSKDSIYYSIDSLPISVEKYKDTELKNYECEVK